MSESITYRWERDLFTAVFDVTGTVSAYYPAKVSGPPDSCYPAEGGEVEIESVELIEIESGGKPVARIHPKLKALLEKRFQAELDEGDTVWEAVDQKMFELAQEHVYDWMD